MRKVKYVIWEVKIFFIFLFKYNTGFRHAWYLSSSFDEYWEENTPSEMAREEWMNSF